MGKKKVRNGGEEPGRNVLLFHCAHIVTFGYSFSFFSPFLCFSSLLLSTHFSSSRYYNSNRSFLLSPFLISPSFFFFILHFPLSSLDFPPLSSFVIMRKMRRKDMRQKKTGKESKKERKKKEALRRQVEMMRNGKRCSSYVCVFRKYKKMEEETEKKWK